ncbi:YggU family protein [Candidatus Woesearchaeota archaeon]|nr:YggU family protein [Candidatus Woesearchaeota archaeon]
MIEQHIQKGLLKVVVKTNSAKTQILGYDEQKKVLRIALKSQPQDGKANTELIKYLSKQLKKKIEIKNGHTSKNKTLKIS